MRSTHILFAALLLTSIFLGACGPAAPGTSADQPADITISDALGHTLIFEVPPQRIVITGKANWLIGHTLYLFPEADGRVIAWEERGGSTSDFLTAISPGFAEVTALEEGAGAEQIAPFQPDLVILKDYLRDSLGNPMEEIGMNVYYANLETPEQFFAEIITFGELFNNQAHAEDIVRFYQDRLAVIESRIAALDESEYPSVLVIQHTSTGEDVAFTVPPITWMQSLEVINAGGDPVWDEVAAQGWTTVSFEQIAAWDPDVVLVIAFRGDPDALVAELEASPEWQVLRAMQEGQVYAFPADYRGWDLPDPRWILGTTWVAKTLHPELFEDIDMMEEVYAFFTEMYGMDIEQVDTVITPMLMGDIP